ncbi:MAG: DEAD/DEAH box helicase [Candidatus Eremiobacteraeota bacterium]|nr:DEAD/DEAH box helicase [Candidatus Eremiobacteraeota bacterium]
MQGNSPRSVEGVIDDFVSARRGREIITHIEHIKAREARHAPWPSEVPGDLAGVFQNRGIKEPYLHQHKAWNAIFEGRHTVIVTPTASGKTLCYNVPVLKAILGDPSARNLYLFPTKALSQDQVAELQEIVNDLGSSICTYTYDGDTPADARRAIRARAHVVVSNPDMLHTAILPHHAKWANFFGNLKYVVIDELHTYRGVFGSHFCNVIRRLKRLAAFHGSRPVFILCSATIANPGELASKLIEEEVSLIDENGAPSGEKFFIFYNPPVINAQLGIRKSYLTTARSIAMKFLGSGAQTIVFASSRLNVEVLTRYLKERLERRPDMKGLIRGYRGGYLPTTRREIERGLRTGEILGVVSTNALELGIDIGTLQACVMAGYPGSVASTWQQAGRAGRHRGVSAAVFVARSDPLDQFIVNHPEYFFGKSPEHGLINADNLQILVSHIKCAAFELPLKEDERFGRENLGEILRYLEEKGILHRAGDAWHWTQETYPADEISLRTISNENFVVMDMDAENRVIAEVDFTSAPSTLYEDAIYLCEAQSYHVKKLDYAQRKAFVRKVDVEYYTDAITSTKVRILESFAQNYTSELTREHGEVHVAWKVSGFKKIKFSTRENVGYGPISLPDQEMHTTAYWFTVKPAFLFEMGFTRAQVIDGLMGVAYLLHHTAPFLLMCDTRDIQRSVGDRNAQWFVGTLARERGRSAPGIIHSDDGMELPVDSLERFEPTIFLYDDYPGGIGFSPLLYDYHGTLLSRSLSIVSRCPCSAGCPSCVGPPEEMGKESKKTALEFLRRVLRDESQVQA